MEYNFLGKSGLRVSNLCLGTMTFGDTKYGSNANCPTQVDEQKSHEILDKFVEYGGNFIDTANVYGMGESERILGEWLRKQNREKLVIASKCFYQLSRDPSSRGLGRRQIIQSCEGTLRRLQTDYIDLYQTHVWDSTSPLEETLRTLDDLVRAGKVRYIGVSNLCGWQMQKVADMTKHMGLTSVVSLQQQYNLLCRSPELEEFKVCINEGIGVLPWSPLKGGLLTGKFKRGEVPSSENSRIGAMSKNSSIEYASSPAWKRYDNNSMYWSLLESMKTIGNSLGKSVPQIAIRWLLQKNVVSSVIIGATSLKQLEDNIGAASGWKLSKEQMEELDRLTMPEVNYPYDMLLATEMNVHNTFYPSPCVRNIYMY